VAITAARAKQICTKAELDLVLQSTTKHIGNLDSKQLKSALRRSRTLRDKWRDLTHSQTRDTKATSPEKLGEANARSSEKATLFDETLSRFQKRLSKLEAEATKAAPTKKAASTVDHRADRAAIRETLSAKTELLNASAAAANNGAATNGAATNGAATNGAATKTAPVKKKAAAKTDAGGNSSPAKKTATKKKATSKLPTRKPKPVAVDGLAAAQLAADQPLATSDKLTGAAGKRNLKAKTKAKATAVARSGAPRIQGHVSSQGRRNQAKRNAR
jgi:hypothetical protein